MEKATDHEPDEALKPEQKGIEAILPYGNEPDKIATHLVLINEGCKKVERWDLEGETKSLWTSHNCLSFTEVIKRPRADAV